eukprot:scaffold24398_cov133-Isochrysis_galbana.AAC.7
MSARGAMTQERVAPTALSFQCSWHGATAREGDCIRRLAGAYPFLDDICSNPSGVPTFLRVSCAVVTAELLGWRAKVARQQHLSGMRAGVRGRALPRRPSAGKARWSTRKASNRRWRGRIAFRATALGHR